MAKHGSFPAWDNSVRDLEARCKRAGVPRITVRDQRRSHGKALAALGVAPHLIGGMLRHMDSRMAERVYAQPEREDVGRPGRERDEVEKAPRLESDTPASCRLAAPG